MRDCRRMQRNIDTESLRIRSDRAAAFARSTARRWRGSRRIRTLQARSRRSRRVPAGTWDATAVHWIEESSRLWSENFQNTHNGNSCPLRAVLQVGEYFNHSALQQIRVEQDAEFISTDVQQWPYSLSTQIAVKICGANPAVPES